MYLHIFIFGMTENVGEKYIRIICFVINRNACEMYRGFESTELSS